MSERNAGVVTTAKDRQCTIATTKPIMREKNTDTIDNYGTLLNDKKSDGKRAFLVNLETKSITNDAECKKTNLNKK